MSAERSYEDYSCSELITSPVVEPFAEMDRLFILRRPLDIAVPSTVRARNTISDLYNRLDILEAHNLPTDIIELPTAPSVEGMRQLFQKHKPTKQDGFMVIGGDGISSNANAAAQQEGFNGPLIHIGRGNARDQAHMIFTRRDIKDPVRALIRSRLADLYLLRITSDKPNANGDYITNPTAYWTAGDLIHAVAQTVGSRDFRARTAALSERARLVAEAKIAFDEIGNGNLLTVEDNDGKRKRSDIVVSNGQRMAKRVRFGGLKLLRPGSGHIEVRNSSHPAVVSVLGRAALGSFPHLPPDETYSFKLTTQDGDIIKVQRDGEIDEYPDDTTFTVAIEERPLSFAATLAA